MSSVFQISRHDREYFCKEMCQQNYGKQQIAYRLVLLDAGCKCALAARFLTVKRACESPG